MIRDDLMDLALKTLELLIDTYKSGEISYEQFEKNISMKIKFIQDHMNIITSTQKKAYINEILKCCKDISIQRNNSSFYNIKL